MGNATLNNFVKISVGGENKLYQADMTLSSSYSVGGDSIDIGATPFNTAITNMFVSANDDNSSRYAFRIDTATNKIKAYDCNVDTLSTSHHHSLQTVDEVKAVVADVATATTFPVCVNAVYSLAGGVTGYMKIIPGDQAPATGECAVVLGGPKTFTFNAADAVTSAQLNYLYVATTDDDIGNDAFTSLVEVAATTNLSSITTKVFLLGS